MATNGRFSRESFEAKVQVVLDQIKTNFGDPPLAATAICAWCNEPAIHGTRWGAYCEDHKLGPMTPGMERV